MPSKSPAVELEVGGRTVRVSNPEKPYFAELGIRKIDVVEYYLAVGDGILRALRDRPTTMERWPDGVRDDVRMATRDNPKGGAFYQKRVPKGAPEWVPTARIEFPSGRTADEVAPNELAVVTWAANLGTIVFHPWPVRAADVDHPDELRIDLDPQPATDFVDAVEAARTAQEMFDELGWRAFPKTSGGRGVHLYVRISPLWDFTTVRRATIAFARELERRRPELVTSAWWKEERGEKVFVDYNQMARDRTIACAYSVRANSAATVSMPVTWEELGQADPLDFTVRTAPARFAEVGDRHAEIDDVHHDLTPLLEWAARDERDAKLGDLPYPPEYPKQPGEPLRVQPSRRAK